MRIFAPPGTAPVIPPAVHLHTISPEMLGVAIAALQPAAPVSQAQVANLATFVPFSIATAITALRLFSVNGAAVAGNIDVGIYDTGGVRLASAGSTAQAGINAVQYFDIVDLGLQPGSYYAAIAVDGILATLLTYNLAADRLTALGLVQQAAAFPLPANAVFAAFAQTAVPIFGLSRRATP
jgi:hypothetical protein